MSFSPFHLAEAFVFGSFIGSGLTYLYFTHDKRVADQIRGLFSFTEGYDDFIKPYGREPDFSDEYLAGRHKIAKLLIKRCEESMNPYLLAAQMVVSVKLGSSDNLDAVQALRRMRKTQEGASKQ